MMLHPSQEKQQRPNLCLGSGRLIWCKFFFLLIGQKANPKLLLTLVLLWTGKGHYRRYFYVRSVQKTVSKENCGRHFLKNTSRTVTTAIILSQELRFRRLYANKKENKQIKKADRGYVRAKYRGPLLDLWDLPLQNPSTIIPQYVRLTFFMSPPRFTETLTINPPLLPTAELCLLDA